MIAGAYALIALTGRNPSLYSAWRSQSAVKIKGETHCASAQPSVTAVEVGPTERWAICESSGRYRCLHQTSTRALWAQSDFRGGDCQSAFQVLRDSGLTG